MLRVRIRLFTVIQSRIRPFTLMRIRGSCSPSEVYTPPLWASTALHSYILSLYSSWTLPLMRIRVRPFDFDAYPDPASYSDACRMQPEQISPRVYEWQSVFQPHCVDHRPRRNLWSTAWKSLSPAGKGKRYLLFVLLDSILCNPYAGFFVLRKRKKK